MNTTIYLGRQPILDRRRRTYGYELLYRDGDRAGAFFEDPDDATRQVVERALLSWGMANIVGTRHGFINAAAGFLQSGMYSLLARDQVVIELLEDIVYDIPTLEAVRGAKLAGYRMALDDVVAANGEHSEVFELADIIKVDLPGVEGDLETLVRDLRQRAPHAVLLAEKVEERADFDRCLALGFDLFQGYFFAKPEVLSRTSAPSRSLAALSLIGEIQDPEISLSRLSTVVQSDPTLAFRLLTLVNSSALGLTTRVRSIDHAIVLLGTDRVRHLAVLLAMSNTDAADLELMVLSATRARMAGTLASDPGLADGAVTVGLLSAIDVIFDAPMEELLGRLSLVDDVRDALLLGSGPLGDILATVHAYERADLAVLAQLHPAGIDDVRDAFGEATAWADSIRQHLAPAV